MGHIPPVFGRVGTSVDYKKITGAVFSNFNGKKDWNLYSPTGVDNEQEAVLNVGTPSWYTINMSLLYRFNEKIYVKLGVNNLFDTYYKTFASGISAPGRNMIAELKISI